MTRLKHTLGSLQAGPVGLPNDSAIPALAAIRARGLAGAIPALRFDDDRPVHVRVRSYTPGRRATLDVRAGERHFAVKAYAKDATPEAEVHEALANGCGRDADVRVPPLLTWDRELQLLVVGWLEGLAANELVRRGHGKRAGELAARWVQCAASFPAKIGPPRDASDVLRRVEKWVAVLAAADPELGAGAAAVAQKLARTRPRQGATRLVHGSLYARRVLDLGRGPGLVNWRRVGQGPLELDAGVFLATIWRTGRMHEPLQAEAARAEEAFVAGTAGLLDERAVAWHRSAMLLRLACKQAPRQSNGPVRRRQRAPLGEAARLAAGVG